MIKVLIIGASDLGGQIANEIYSKKQNLKIVGFLDDFATVGDKKEGFSIIGKIEKSLIMKLFEEKFFTHLIIGVGYNHFEFRKNIYNLFMNIIPFYTFIHNSAFIDKSSTVREGSIILAGVIIDKNVIINNNVFINIGSVISHDTIIGSHSFISPSVAIAGFVSVGECCFIGINSTIINNIKIVDKCFIGAGSLVLKNLNSKGKYFGSPVKIRKNEH
jgi:sugar O-acyltransferase (sialic acid O-acetyltransferase NeuD family)